MVYFVPLRAEFACWTFFHFHVRPFCPEGIVFYNIQRLGCLYEQLTGSSGRQANGR